MYKTELGYVVLKHDGFNRFEAIRESRNTGYGKPNVYIYNCQCDNCGNTVRTLYRYGIKHDDSNRLNWNNGEFCSASCARSN